MHGSYNGGNEPNGSKAVTLLLRLANLVLALSSAVVMATASESTINGRDNATAKVTVTFNFKDYPPFVYLVGFNIAAAVLQSGAIYLQLGKGDDDEGPKLPMVLQVVVDVAVQALLFSATGAVFAAVAAYGPELNACAAGMGAGRFCDQVHRSKLLSLGASFSAALNAVAKDVPLKFSVWPVWSDW